MKLFTTKSIETVKYCQEYFDFSFIPSVLWAKRVSKFEVSFERFLSVLLLFDFIWFVLLIMHIVVYSTVPCKFL